MDHWLWFPLGGAWVPLTHGYLPPQEDEWNYLLSRGYECDDESSYSEHLAGENLLNFDHGRVQLAAAWAAAAAEAAVESLF